MHLTCEQVIFYRLMKSCNQHVGIFECIRVVKV